MFWSRAHSKTHHVIFFHHRTFFFLQFTLWIRSIFRYIEEGYVCKSSIHFRISDQIYNKFLRNNFLILNTFQKHEKKKLALYENQFNWWKIPFSNKGVSGVKDIFFKAFFTRTKKSAALTLLDAQLDGVGDILFGFWSWKGSLIRHGHVRP